MLFIPYSYMLRISQEEVHRPKKLFLNSFLIKMLEKHVSYLRHLQS